MICNYRRPTRLHCTQSTPPPAPPSPSRPPARFLTVNQFSILSATCDDAQAPQLIFLSPQRARALSSPPLILILSSSPDAGRDRHGEPGLGSPWLGQPPSIQHVALWPYSRSVGQKGIEKDPSPKWQPLPSLKGDSFLENLGSYRNEEVAAMDPLGSETEKHIVDIGGDKRTN